MGRTRLVWTGRTIEPEVAGIKNNLPELTTVNIHPHGLGRLPSGSVVLVDPNGLAMMRYPPGADPRGMRADLERLLKYSWSA